MPRGSVLGPRSSQGAREPPSPQGQAGCLRNCPESGQRHAGSPAQWNPAASWSLTSSPISLAELLPHLGGLQLQGHEAAFPAEVRLLRAPQLGRGWAEGRTPHHRPTIPLSISPGPLCWLLWPSWMPSRKWPTWPPTPEVGRGRGWRLGRPQVRFGGRKGPVEYDPGRGRQAQSQDLEFCSRMKGAGCRERERRSLEDGKRERVGGDAVFQGFLFSLRVACLTPQPQLFALPYSESHYGFFSPTPIRLSESTPGQVGGPSGLALASPLLSRRSSRNLGPLFLRVVRTKTVGTCWHSHLHLGTPGRGCWRAGGDFGWLFGQSFVLASPRGVGRTLA